MKMNLERKQEAPKARWKNFNYFFMSTKHPAAIPWLKDIVQMFWPRPITTDQWVDTGAPNTETGAWALLYRLAVFPAVGHAVLSYAGLDLSALHPFIQAAAYSTTTHILASFAFGLVGHWNYYMKLNGGWVSLHQPGDSLPDKVLNWDAWWMRIKLSGWAFLIHSPLLLWQGHWLAGLFGTGLAVYLHIKYNRSARAKGRTPLAAAGKDDFAKQAELRMLAESQMSEGRLDEAISTFNILASEPNLDFDRLGVILYRLGEAYAIRAEATKSAAEARPDWERSQHSLDGANRLLKPEHPLKGDLFFMLGQTLIAQGRYVEARYAFSAAISRGKQSADAYRGLSRSIDMQARAEGLLGTHAEMMEELLTALAALLGTYGMELKIDPSAKMKDADQVRLAGLLRAVYELDLGIMLDYDEDGYPLIFQRVQAFMRDLGIQILYIEAFTNLLEAVSKVLYAEGWKGDGDRNLERSVAARMGILLPSFMKSRGMIHLRKWRVLGRTLNGLAALAAGGALLYYGIHHPSAGGPMEMGIFDWRLSLLAGPLIWLWRLVNGVWTGSKAPAPVPTSSSSLYAAAKADFIEALRERDASAMQRHFDGMTEAIGGMKNPSLERELQSASWAIEFVLRPDHRTGSPRNFSYASVDQIEYVLKNSTVDESAWNSPENVHKEVPADKLQRSFWKTWKMATIVLLVLISNLPLIGDRTGVPSESHSSVIKAPSSEQERSELAEPLEHLSDGKDARSDLAEGNQSVQTRDSFFSKYFFRVVFSQLLMAAFLLNLLVEFMMWRIQRNYLRILRRWAVQMSQETFMFNNISNFSLEEAMDKLPLKRRRQLLPFIHRYLRSSSPVQAAVWLIINDKKLIPESRSHWQRIWEPLLYFPIFYRHAKVRKHAQHWNRVASRGADKPILEDKGSPAQFLNILRQIVDEEEKSISAIQPDNSGKILLIALAVGGTLLGVIIALAFAGPAAPVTVADLEAIKNAHVLTSNLAFGSIAALLWRALSGDFAKTGGLKNPPGAGMRRRDLLGLLAVAVTSACAPFISTMRPVGNEPTAEDMAALARIKRISHDLANRIERLDIRDFPEKIELIWLLRNFDKRIKNIGFYRGTDPSPIAQGNVIEERLLFSLDVLDKASDTEAGINLIHELIHFTAKQKDITRRADAALRLTSGIHLVTDPVIRENLKRAVALQVHREFLTVSAESKVVKSLFNKDWRDLAKTQTPFLGEVFKRYADFTGENDELMREFRVIMALIRNESFLAGISVSLYSDIAKAEGFTIRDDRDVIRWLSTWIDKPEYVDWNTDKPSSAAVQVLNRMAPLLAALAVGGVLLGVMYALAHPAAPLSVEALETISSTHAMVGGINSPFLAVAWGAYWLFSRIVGNSANGAQIKAIDTQIEVMSKEHSISFELFDVHEGLLRDTEEQVRKLQGLRRNEDLLRLKRGKLAAGEVEALHNSQKYGADAIAVDVTSGQIEQEEYKYLLHAVNNRAVDAARSKVAIAFTSKQGDVDPASLRAVIINLNERLGENVQKVEILDGVIDSRENGEDVYRSIYRQILERMQLTGKGITVEYVSRGMVAFLFSETERLIYCIKNMLLERITPVPERLRESLKQIGIIDIQA